MDRELLAKVYRDSTRMSNLLGQIRNKTMLDKVVLEYLWAIRAILLDLISEIEHQQLRLEIETSYSPQKNLP